MSSSRIAKSTARTGRGSTAFHIGKKTQMGASGAVVGAIVAGPIGALLGGVFGTALGAAASHDAAAKPASTKPKTKGGAKASVSVSSVPRKRPTRASRTPVATRSGKNPRRRRQGGSSNSAR